VMLKEVAPKPSERSIERRNVARAHVYDFAVAVDCRNVRSLVLREHTSIYIEGVESQEP
jgi:hypothetical protein